MSSKDLSVVMSLVSVVLCIFVDHGKSFLSMLMVSDETHVGFHQWVFGCVVVGCNLNRTALLIHLKPFAVYFIQITNNDK